MARTARALLLTLGLIVTALAGCLTPDGRDLAPGATVVPRVDGLLPISIANVMGFTQQIVEPAVGLGNDLYEPTLEVSDTGTLYVAAHVVGAATTGTPAYVSRDDGATWTPLPFLGPVAAPSPLQGATPPPGDEGFIVAGENGQAWMADIYAAGFSVTGWCDDGASQCYDDRQAYDRAESTTTCTPMSLNDRPWAAYASGTLLLVNNPGGGPMQIGVMDVPPAAPVGIVGVNGPTWNMCASEGGSIPGVPAMRADGLFAVPQMDGSGEDQVLNVVIGNKEDIFAVETKTVFPVTSAGGGTSNGGRTAFDREGTLFVGARNNTLKEEVPGDILNGGFTIADEGRFILAVSTDGGQTFQNATFATGTPVRSLYLDGNMFGRGALLTWSQLGDDEDHSDWYVAHLFAGPDGEPLVQDVTLAVDEGPHSSAHVMGAAAGPDGRAYFLNFQDEADPAKYTGSSPISVWIQQGGVTLPIEAEAVEG
ncbi:MAG TPA: hypothetical protein VM370_07155 [Candidatus Thermoplasmatota archaeon]|nr:hypothetical protein [Candidatus Thermoplasmatota archaeon]